MIAELESAIIARLKAKAPQVVHVDAAKGQPTLPRVCYMLATQKGTAESVAMSGNFKQNLDVSLWVSFQDHSGDSARRAGAYSLIEALAQFLFQETLGLDIRPLRYTGFAEVTIDEERAAGLAIFQLDFSTSHVVTKISDEAAGDLLKIGLKYYLPAAEEPSAQDEVILGQS
ncbi:MAG TPA: DUF1834 family protein [Elusimicrobiales bacterium]|nr:DUF1834 family protein [Elusimicrobiales bacterium]